MSCRCDFHSDSFVRTKAGDNDSGHDCKANSQSKCPEEGRGRGSRTPVDTSHTELVLRTVLIVKTELLGDTFISNSLHARQTEAGVINTRKDVHSWDVAITLQGMQAI